MTIGDRKVQPLPESLVSGRPQTKKGYYSLLQFEPSKYRQERVNLAVLLEGPEYHYRGAKRLRHMERLLQIIDPMVDVRLARAFAQEFEDDFKSSEPDGLIMPKPILVESYKPEGIIRWQTKLEKYSKNPFKLTKPRVISFDASMSFDSQLMGLYETMVSRPRLDIQGEERKKKEYVRREATSTLRQFIEVEIDPPEIKGRRFDDHSFDAAQKVKKSRTKYFEFSSFDIAQPNTNAVRLFLQSVEDVTASESEDGGLPALTKDDFFLIFQNPEARKPQAQKVADLAVEYVENAGIRAIQLGVGIKLLGEQLAHLGEAAD